MGLILHTLKMRPVVTHSFRQFFEKMRRSPERGVTLVSIMIAVAITAIAISGTALYYARLTQGIANDRASHERQRVLERYTALMTNEEVIERSITETRNGQLYKYVHKKPSTISVGDVVNVGLYEKNGSWLIPPWGKYLKEDGSLESVTAKAIFQVTVKATAKPGNTYFLELKVDALRPLESDMRLADRSVTVFEREKAITCYEKRTGAVLGSTAVDPGWYPWNGIAGMPKVWKLSYAPSSGYLECDAGSYLTKVEVTPGCNSTKPQALFVPPETADAPPTKGRCAQFQGAPDPAMSQCDETDETKFSCAITCCLFP
jgi:hypothetical protein